MGRTWIRDPLAVLLPDGVDADAGVVVADGVITETLSRGARPAAPVDEVVDASRKVLLPGLVNTHHHFFQTLTRAWAPVASVGLFDWLTRLYEVWQHLAPADLVIATQTALVELLMSGCTTTSDHHYLFPAGLEEAIDIQVEQALALGIRVHLTRGSMTRGRDDGGLPPQAVIQDPEVIMDDSRRLVARYHDPRPGAMVRIALAPCAPFTVTRQTMRDAAALAEDLDVRLHTHLAETLDEERFLLDTYGLPDRGLPGERRLAGGADLARARHPLRRCRDHPAGRGRGGHHLLSGLQHAARLGHLSGAGTGGRRCTGRARRGWLGLQRRLLADRRRARGSAATTAAVRGGGRHP